MSLILQNPKEQLIVTLSTLRKEWQAAAEGDSLLALEANVGLLLADLLNILDFTSQEQARVLGAELYAEMQAFVSDPENSV